MNAKKVQVMPIAVDVYAAHAAQLQHMDMKVATISERERQA
ncbi:MAG: hypothetical protein V8T45_11175 [Oscillospiraceae bacterium]